MRDELESLDAVFAFLSQWEQPQNGPVALSTDFESSTRPVELFPASPGRGNSLEPVLDEHLGAAMDLDVGFHATQQLLLEYDTQEDVCGLLQSSEEERVQGTSETAEDGAASSSLSTPVPPMGNADIQGAAKQPRRRRASRKEQIDSLRTTIQELTTQLQSRASLRTPSLLGGQRPGCEPFWEKIAARQLERRRNAEEENIKLRQLLKLQVKEAKNLKRVLKRRTKLEMMEKFMGSKLHEDRIYRSPGDNPQVFQELLRDTDSLYISVDKLFLEKGLHDLPCPGRWRQARGNVSNGMFLELTQKTVVPFDRQATDKAMWACLGLADWQGLQSVKDMGKQIHFHPHHTEEAGDTRMSSFFAKTSSSISSLRGVQIRKAVRKYEEADRTVFISQGLVEPKLDGDTDFAGFHTHTTLRVVVKQVDHLASGQGSVSLIESHFSASRFSQGLAAAREICSSTNLDMGVTIWDEAISRISHQVEALLIDETCKKVEGPYLTAPLSRV